MLVRGDTATEVTKKAIRAVQESGRLVSRFGGTIPAKLGVNGAQNRNRPMRELPYLAIELTNPHACWTDIGNTTFITLREQEDHLAGLNPGLTPVYSKLYREWLSPKTGKLPLSYGERFRAWGGCHDQLEAMYRILKAHPSSRKACASLWYPPFDHATENPACNVFFQATIVSGSLEWTTLNRSQDLLNGLTENLLMWAVWANELALRLGVPLGPLRVITSNAHIYQDKLDQLKLDVKDPYDTWEPHLPEVQYDIIAWLTRAIDTHMLAARADKAEQHIQELMALDPYWGSWKAALVADYLMMDDPPAAVPFARMIQNEFLPNVGTRLERKLFKDNQQSALAELWQGTNKVSWGKEKVVKQ